MMNSFHVIIQKCRSIYSIHRMLDTIFKQILIPRTKIKCKISFPFKKCNIGGSRWALNLVSTRLKIGIQASMPGERCPGPLDPGCSRGFEFLNSWRLYSIPHLRTRNCLRKDIYIYVLQNLYLWIAVKMCCLEKSGNVRLNVNFDKILVGYPQNPRRFFQNRIQPSCAPGPILSFLWFFSFLNSIKKIGKLLITWKGSPRF